MERERQVDSFDAEERNGSEASAVQNLPFFDEYDEPLSLHPPIYHHVDLAHTPPFPLHPQQQQRNQSSSTAPFASFAGTTNQSGFAQWRSDQMISQRIPAATSIPPAILDASAVNRNTQRAAEEKEQKKRRYDKTLPDELPADYSSNHSKSSASEDGFRSLNRLIDRFIETADKIPGNQHNCSSNPTLTDSHLQSRLHQTLPEATVRSLPVVPSAPEHRAHLSSSALYFNTGKTPNILQQPPSSTLYGLPGPPMTTTAAQPPGQTPAALPNRALNHQVTSSTSSSSASVLYASRNLYLPQDEQNLSLYQCLLRQQIEFFAADREDVTVIQGRNKPVVRRQVGIRCIHCAHLPIKSRDKGSSYFSARLDALYQSAQNLAKKHLLQKCRHIPPSVREQLSQLKQGVPRMPRPGSTNLQSVGAGKGYWAEAARKVGVFEDETQERLEFRF